MKEIIILIIAIALLIISIIILKNVKTYVTLFYNFDEDYYTKKEYEKIELKASLDDDYVTEKTEDSSKYISDYKIKNHDKRSFLLCKYKEKFQNIKYNVLFLNRKNRIKGYVSIDDSNQKDYSQVISLPKNIKNVGFQILEVNNEEVNTSELKNIKLKRNIVITSIATTALSFGALAIIRLAIVLILFGKKVEGFLSTSFANASLLLVIVCPLFIGLLNFIYLYLIVGRKGK